MRHLLCFLIFALANTEMAGAALSIAPRLSAAQLLACFQPGFDSTPDFCERRYAEGYLAGVADAAQGRLWCDTGRVKTVELDGIVLGELKKLPAAARQSDAAALIVAILARRFPCSHPPGG